MSEGAGPDDKNKNQLSHALSLPLQEGKTERLIKKQQSLRVKSSARQPIDEGQPTIAAPIKDRSWSFGNVAKAVGTGVTAFGSGVVQGTKVVGSGVVQGSKVVGSGVVQGTMVVGSGVVSVGTGVVQVGTSVGTGVVHGTKVAGRVTKDVTLAAGKGVLNAGELVGSAAVSGVSAVSQASVMAISDTTAWVKEKKGMGHEFSEHDVLPGETLEEIAEKHRVDVRSIILINELESRKILTGRKLLLPNEDLMQSRLYPRHSMDHVYVRAHGDQSVVIVTEFYDVTSSNDPSKIVIKTTSILSVSINEELFLPGITTSSTAAVVVVPESTTTTEEVVTNCSSTSSRSSSSTNRDSSKVVEKGQEEPPPPKKYNEVFEVDTKKLVVAKKRSSSKQEHQYKLKIILRNNKEKEGEEKANEEKEEEEEEEINYLIVEKDMFTLVKFLRLWIPERLNLSDEVHDVIEARQFDLDFIKAEEGSSSSASNDGDDDDDNDNDNDDEDDEIQRRKDLLLPKLLHASTILTEDHIRRLHKSLPPQNQNETWHLQYSTSTDGFSLQNLFRRLACVREPILLVIQDYEGVIFGAFLTCIPQLSDAFIGSGKSWLFSDRNNTFKVYPWTGKNDYFYKGNVKSIFIGGGDGKFGLYLDSDLNRGRTDSCLTFNNEPLSSEDFNVKCLECWSFI